MITRTRRTPGIGQDLFRIFLSMLHYASGLPSPLLKYLDQPATHLEGYCYVYLWKLLDERKIQLTFACVTCSNLEQEDDHLIICRACDKTKDELDDVSIQIIIHYRRSFQVHQLSNICTADGSYILEFLF